MYLELAMLEENGYRGLSRNIENIISTPKNIFLKKYDSYYYKYIEKIVINKEIGEEALEFCLRLSERLNECNINNEIILVNNYPLYVYCNKKLEFLGIEILDIEMSESYLGKSIYNHCVGELNCNGLFYDIKMALEYMDKHKICKEEWQPAYIYRIIFE
jgi:hypothetical protein